MSAKKTKRFSCRVEYKCPETGESFVFENGQSVPRLKTSQKKDLAAFIVDGDGDIDVDVDSGDEGGSGSDINKADSDSGFVDGAGVD